MGKEARILRTELAVSFLFALFPISPAWTQKQPKPDEERKSARRGPRSGKGEFQGSGGAGDPGSFIFPFSLTQPSGRHSSPRQALVVPRERNPSNQGRGQGKFTFHCSPLTSHCLSLGGDSVKRSRAEQGELRPQVSDQKSRNRDPNPPESVRSWRRESSHDVCISPGLTCKLCSRGSDSEE